MKIVQLSVLVLFIIFLIQCGVDQRADDPPAPRKIEVNYIPEIKLSELVEPGYNYLPLQTDQAPLIGYVDKLIATDSAYYILDVRFSKNLLKFDKRGKFLHTIGKSGEGNGEYVSPVEFAVHDNYVEIFDSNFSVLKFTNKGTFIEEYRVPYSVYEAFQFSNTDKIIYSPSDFSPEGRVDIGVISIISNDFKNIRASFFPYEEVLDDAPFPGFLSKYENKFSYVKPILAQFYTIDKEGKIAPRFTADFGKFQWPIDAEALKSDEDGGEELFFGGGIMSIAHRLCENKNYLTFQTFMIDEVNAPSKINDDRDRWLCIYNKSTEKIYAIKKIINDIDGNVIPFPIAVDGDDFIGVISSELFSKGFNKENVINQDERFSSVESMMDTLSNASNPILLKFRLRPDLFN